MASGRKFEFDWNEANVSHIARHRITPEEAEQVLTGAPLLLTTEERSGEERHVEIGETDGGRVIVVAWTWRNGRIRVVTAFPAKRKWRAFYERMKGRE